MVLAQKKKKKIARIGGFAYPYSPPPPPPPPSASMLANCKQILWERYLVFWKNKFCFGLLLIGWESSASFLNYDAKPEQTEITSDGEVKTALWIKKPDTVLFHYNWLKKVVLRLDLWTLNSQFHIDMKENKGRTSWIRGFPIEQDNSNGAVVRALSRFRTRRHMWVEFVLVLAPTFFLFLFFFFFTFLPLQKANTSKFQFDGESEGHSSQ